MEEEIIVLTHDISRENAHFGESRENSHYECRNCCFCDRAAPVTWCEEEKILRCKEKPPSFVQPEWQDEIDRRIGGETFEEKADSYDYRQIIHQKCRSILTEGESIALREKNRNNIYIPELHDYGVMRFNYRTEWVPQERPNHQLMMKYNKFTGGQILTYAEGKSVVYQGPYHGNPLCARCDAIVSCLCPGFCYPEGGYGERRYIHDTCYSDIKSLRSVGDDSTVMK